ncbi:hypothetical protein GVAV_002726 [Gurleya vavrai]
MIYRGKEDLLIIIFLFLQLANFASVEPGKKDIKNTKTIQFDNNQNIKKTEKIPVPPPMPNPVKSKNNFDIPKFKITSKMVIEQKNKLIPININENLEFGKIKEEFDYNYDILQDQLDNLIKIANNLENSKKNTSADQKNTNKNDKTNTKLFNNDPSTDNKLKIIKNFAQENNVAENKIKNTTANQNDTNEKANDDIIINVKEENDKKNITNDNTKKTDQKIKVPITDDDDKKGELMKTEPKTEEKGEKKINEAPEIQEKQSSVTNTEEKKPFYKKVWFIILISILIILVIGGFIYGYQKMK